MKTTLITLKGLFDKIHALPEPKHNAPFRELEKILAEVLAVLKEHVPVFGAPFTFYKNQFLSNYDRMVCYHELCIGIQKPHDEGALLAGFNFDLYEEYNFKEYKRSSLENIRDLSATIARKRYLTEMNQ